MDGEAHVGDLRACICGLSHPIKTMLGGVPIVACPWAPPDRIYMMSDALTRRLPKYGEPN